MCWLEPWTNREKDVGEKVTLVHVAKTSLIRSIVVMIAVHKGCTAVILTSRELSTRVCIWPSYLYDNYHPTVYRTGIEYR